MHDIGILGKGTYEKITMRHLGTKKPEIEPLSAEEIRKIREQAHMSQSVFAHYLNVTVNIDQPNLNTACDTLCVYRIQNGDALSGTSRRPLVRVLFDTLLSADAGTSFAINNVDSGRAGMALTNTKTNTGMSAQLPYYSSAGFSVSNMYNEYSNGDNPSDANNDWWAVEWRYNKLGNASTATGRVANAFYATGPDFDFVYFVNVPILHLTTVTPVS